MVEEGPLCVSEAARTGQRGINTGGGGGDAFTCQMLAVLMRENKREFGFMKKY